MGTLTAILEETPAELSTVGRGVPPALSGIVQRCLSKGREERFRSAHDLALSLEAVLQAPAGAASLQEVEEKSPYPGLMSFTEKDAAHFFGREAEVKALWQRLQSRKLLAVIGPSGAGKTSFLRAGVIAARPEGWGAVCATPGARPALGLAQALTPELAGDAEAMSDLLRGVSEVTETGEGERAVSAVRRWRSRHGEALLVIDQFEELFTLSPKETQQRFAALLGRLASEADVHVVLSLRDDFLIRCSEHEPLAPVFESLTPLPGLTADGLRQALVEPAKKRGYGFEDEALVDEMVESVEGARGALPLLAFAVSRLWEKRDRERKLLTRATYEEIGGVAGALAQHAEATMDRVGAERQDVVREIFRNLVTAQGTRAVVDRDELLSAFPDKQAPAEVLRELIDARLVTSYEVEGKEGEPSHHRVEVVHESLLKAWPRLVRWQAQDEEGALLRDQLKQAAHLWQEKSRSPDLLWSGTSFREYELWRERYQGQLTALEEQFGKAMTDRAQRTRRLRRAAVTAVVVALSVVAIVVSWSRHQAAKARDEAREAALRAEASRVVALGKLELETEPTLALAYARKSLEVHDSSEARRLALEALWRGPVARVLAVPRESEVVSFVTPSPDGQWLSCSGWGGVITLVAADGKTTRVLPKNRNAARIRIVLFSDDSRQLATFASGDPETVVWSVEGQEVARFRPGGYPRRFSGDELVLILEQRPGEQELEFVARRIGSPEARLAWRVERGGTTDLTRSRFAYARDEGLFARPLVSPVTTRAGVKFGEHDSRVADVNFHEGTGWIVSFDERREVRIWDGATHRLLRTLQGLDPDRLFGAPLLDTRGTFLAWHSLRERAFPLWDLAGPPDAEPVLLRKSEVTGDAGGGAFLPDGRWLVTALLSKVAFWPLQMPWPRVIRVGPSPKAAFTPDSTQIVACGTTGTSVYPLTPDAPAAHPLAGGRVTTCYGLAMDPSGRYVLLAAAAWGPVLAPLDGREAPALVRVPPTTSISAVALDAAGRWAVTAVEYAPDPRDRVLHVVDRRTGTARAFPLPGTAAESAWAGGVQSLRFVSDGRLMAAGTAGLRIWNLETGANEPLDRTPCGLMDASADGRLVVVGCELGVPARGADSEGANAAYPGPPFELLAIDTSTGERRTIETHGRDFASVAVSPSGELLATGDSSGTVRVGRIDGSEPHLLVGAGGSVGSLAFSPDGRWIASTAGNDIRLWPMPDLSQPPLHTLPHDVLLAKLDSLTNVRVVEDKDAPTGYKVDLAPFPGWKDVPAW